MGKHEDNVKKIEAFMKEHKLSAFNREEIQLRTDVSSGAVRSVLREMHKEGKLEKQLVKERNGEKRVYYFWRRCDNLAGQRCVGEKDIPSCPAGDVCCIFCERECDTYCPSAEEYRKKDNA